MMILYVKVSLIVFFILVTSYIGFYEQNKRVLKKQRDDQERFDAILDKNIKEVGILSLVGIADDLNGDYKFIQAVEKISLSPDTRIKKL